MFPYSHLWGCSTKEKSRNSYKGDQRVVMLRCYVYGQSDTGWIRQHEPGATGEQETLQGYLLHAATLLYDEKPKYIFVLGWTSLKHFFFFLTELLHTFIFREKMTERIMKRFLTLSGVPGHCGYSEYLLLNT